MGTSQLLSGALAASLVLAAAGCNRTEANREAHEAAAEVRTAAAHAGDRLADGWLTTKVLAQYFADREIKARYINVTTRDGVVSLSGYVESPEARMEAVQIARNTNGVRGIEDKLLIGVAPGKDTFEAGTGGPDTPGAVATAGDSDYDASIAASAATAAETDERVTSMVQARFFLDPVLKVRSIDVQTRGGVVTLRGGVASEEERAQALLTARNTTGVGRVEDLLTVGSSQ